MEKHYDVIVVGAGVAGSAIATTFARQGREVLLLERSLKEPDRIVGELLQPGGIAALDKLGLSSAVDDIDAIPVRGYHIYWKDEEVTFLYPSLEDRHDTPGSSTLPSGKIHGAKIQEENRPEGRSFHHGRFVSRLRDIAEAEAQVTLVEGTVISLVTDKQTGHVVGVDCSGRAAGSSTVGDYLQPCHLFTNFVAVPCSFGCCCGRSKFQSPRPTLRTKTSRKIKILGSRITRRGAAIPRPSVWIDRTRPSDLGVSNRFPRDAHSDRYSQFDSRRSLGQWKQYSQLHRGYCSSHTSKTYRIWGYVRPANWAIAEHAQ